MLAGGDWEDVPSGDMEQLDNFLGHHSGIGTVPVVESERIHRIHTVTPQQKRKKKSIVDKVQLHEAILTTAYHSSNFILDIVLQAVQLMRLPLSILLFLLMLPFVMTRISAALRPAFAPICYIPFVSRSPLCVMTELPSTIPKLADFSPLMQVESSKFGSKFGQLLDGSARSTELFFNLRQAESAPVDLAVIIRHSNLKSNERLADLVTAFVKDSNKTAECLFMFGSKVDTAVEW